MHILILADAVDNQNAGIHMYTKKLIQNLLKLDKSNTYTFIHSKQNGFFEGTNHYIVPRGRYPGGESVRRLIKIPRLIRRLKPDMVMEPCHIGPFLIPKNIKRILTVHDLTSILFPQFHTTRNKLIHKLLLKRSIKNADLILTPSQNTKSDIENLYKPKAKIVVTPLAADAPEKSANGSPYPPYLLYIGTIEPRKNLETLIDAFLELDIKEKLIIAGQNGWKNAEILKKLKDPRILYKGPVTEEEKAQLYKHAKAFIYPSLYEGFGLPPLEALSYGTPIICSTGGSLREVFQGKALLFSPKDKDKLKKHIQSVLKYPQNRTHKALNTWENTAKETLHAIINLTIQENRV